MDTLVILVLLFIVVIVIICAARRTPSTTGGNETGAVDGAVTEMSLPPDELDSYKRELNTHGWSGTTRVLNEYDKYKLGHTYKLPTGHTVLITEIHELRAIEEHPWFSHMTPAQIEEIKAVAKPRPGGGQLIQNIKFVNVTDDKVSRYDDGSVRSRDAKDFHYFYRGPTESKVDRIYLPYLEVHYDGKPSRIVGYYKRNPNWLPTMQDGTNEFIEHLVEIGFDGKSYLRDDTAPPFVNAPYCIYKERETPDGHCLTDDRYCLHDGKLIHVSTEEVCGNTITKEIAYAPDGSVAHKTPKPRELPIFKTLEDGPPPWGTLPPTWTHAGITYSVDNALAKTSHMVVGPRGDLLFMPSTKNKQPAHVLVGKDMLKLHSKYTFVTS